MTSSSRKDTLYASPQYPLADFAFDERVAGVFPDMIRRSVPAYGSVTGLLGLVAGEYAQPHSRLYDLGCSLGAATLAMRRRITQPGCRIIAIDNSPAMVEGCRENIAADNAPTPVDVVCADIRDCALEGASVVTMNFTLQFVTPEERLPLLRRIRAGLLPGGVLLLAEKLRFTDTAEQATLEGLHFAFKRANGYSELEISQKRAALERVLLPDTLEAHRARLQAAGFSQIIPWFQAFNFAALLAIR
ncbi:carboxy-S-adenosyl-L-methionine synthase CmoA [Sulfurivermis fontis]|uniref:carboxy-S-adenosyl-L-methionine synthase CmoA n=1 Tax=Sulfurivermis fontis TaxID=1972068 RepID=UPI000FDB2190|nr:carboxy-S-adenosyl-L-methionine synthase CmoA [Sulfurivermis fontis]